MLAVQIVNYNTPEATDNIVQYIKDKVSIDYFLTVIDNGSNEELISKHTTKRLEKNTNKLGGVLAALEESKKKSPDYYWTISTSMKFNPTFEDPAEELINVIECSDDIVGISPTFTGDLTDPPHRMMATIHNRRFHEAPGSIGMYSLYKGNWILGEGLPDARLTSSWGTDYEMKYKARINNKRLMLSDRITVAITKGTVYQNGKAGKSLSDYEKESRLEMETVLTEKYGADWKSILGVQHYA